MSHLRPRKSTFSAYALAVSTGLLGGHHFYLGRLFHGVVALWTFNFLGMGLLVDLLLMPLYVWCNNRGNHMLAPRDGSRRTLLCKLPFVVFMLIFVAPVSLLGTPWALRTSGLFDLDGAGPDGVSPYRVLGVPQSASLPQVKAAYRHLSLQWHPDRNQGCGKMCDERMSELTKAYAIAKKRAPAEPIDGKGSMLPAGGWGSWIAVAIDDWWLLTEAVGDVLQRAASDAMVRKQRAGGGRSRSRGSKRR